jgi:4-hydroxybenzoate polyprenyltransferase
MLRFLAGASFAGPLMEGAEISLWGGAAVWACVTMSVYVLNGAMDTEEDRINRSGRPVARGDLPVAHAIGAAAALAALGVLGGLVLGGPMAWSVTLALALGWLYSGPPLYLKRWPAGLGAVAILGGLLTYHVGYAANGGGGDLPGLVAFAGVMSLWMGLVGQTKDISDVEGDRQAGRRSGLIAWGEEAMRSFYSGIAISLGAAYALWSGLFATGLLVSAIVVLLGALAVAVLSLGPWSRGGDRSKRRRPYRAFMATQYGAHLAIIVW